MLTELNRRLVAAGVHRIDCLLASGGRPVHAVHPGGHRIRRAQNRAAGFERVLFSHEEELAATAGALRGIAQTRRTLTPQMVAEFEQDITDLARI